MEYPVLRSQQQKYDFLHFLQDVIEVLIAVTVLMFAVIVGVIFFTIFRPEIKAILLSAQKVLFWWV